MERAGASGGRWRVREVACKQDAARAEAAVVTQSRMDRIETSTKSRQGRWQRAPKQKDKECDFRGMGSNNERRGTYWLHPKACLDPTFSCRRAIGRMQDLCVREAREEIQSRVSGAERQIGARKNRGAKMQKNEIVEIKRNAMEKRKKNARKTWVTVNKTRRSIPRFFCVCLNGGTLAW
jgi:hypothetical protein